MIAGPEPFGANHVVLYLRVSSEEQDLAGRERELRAGCARRGWEIAAVYSEKVGGTGRVERKEYDCLMVDAAAARRPWSHLLVWALDRSSREATFTRATQAVLDLETIGVSFHSLKEPTLDTPEDGRPNLGRDVLLALLPVIAPFNSKRRSERVRLAMRELREGRRRSRSGRPLGRPKRINPGLLAQLQNDRDVLKLTWPQIVRKRHVPASSARNWVRAARSAERTSL
jgi:DNA invertase Pin-like site-specific DNA recombinase